jgi:hypothetical protein
VGVEFNLDRLGERWAGEMEHLNGNSFSFGSCILGQIDQVSDVW